MAIAYKSNLISEICNFDIKRDFPKCYDHFKLEQAMVDENIAVILELGFAYGINIDIRSKTENSVAHFRTGITKVYENCAVSRKFLLMGQTKPYWASTNAENPDFRWFENPKDAVDAALKEILSNIEQDL